MARAWMACWSAQRFHVLSPVGAACGGWTGGHAAMGGPVAAVNTLRQSVVHCWAQGQWAGRCRTRRRCGRARRAGTLTTWRRSVAPRATAWLGLLRVPAARSRVWVMAAQMAQALLAANRLEGRCASGPSIRSANTVSMTAWRRWVRSAATVGSVLLVER